MATAKKRASKPRQKKETHIALVIDRSGSMSSIRQQALDALNEQIGTIRKGAKKGGNTFITLVQFTTTVATIFENVPAADVKELTLKDYIPMGVTAMRDGIWTAIQTLKKSAGWRDGDVTITIPDNVPLGTSINVTINNSTVNKNKAFLVVVISDGAENASKEVSQHQLAFETERLEKTGNWTFTYMLSNVNAITTAQSLGSYAVNNVASFCSTQVGMADASLNMSDSLDKYLTMRSKGETKSTNFYSKDSDKKNE